MRKLIILIAVLLLLSVSCKSVHIPVMQVDKCTEQQALQVDESIIILGDSILPNHGDCMGVPGQLSKLYGKKIVSLARGGNLIRDISKQYDEAKKIPGLKTIILDGGANDIMMQVLHKQVNPLLVAAEFHVLLNRILVDGYQPIVILTYNSPADPFSENPMNDYSNLLETICLTLNVTYYDLRTDFIGPALFETGGCKCHPSNQGSQLIAYRLLGILNSM